MKCRLCRVREAVGPWSDKPRYQTKFYARCIRDRILQQTVLTTHAPTEPILKRPYVAQGQDSSCVVVAIINACVYKGVQHPDYDELCDIACCRTGGAIHVKETIEACGPLRTVARCSSAVD